MNLEYLRHVIETKGLLYALRRVAQITTRFASGPRRMEEMVSCIEKDFASRDIRMTFFVTATLLRRNLRIFRRLQDLGQEFAAHGYVHTNLAMKTKEKQLDLIRRSQELFSRFDLPVRGFRSPYLSYNGDTFEALDASLFKWTSNHVVFWERNPNSRNFNQTYFERLQKLYQFSYSDRFISLPTRVNSIIDIPITAPDDEMLFERYHLRTRSEMTDVWLRILGKVYDRGELFHIFFHPERFVYVRDSLRDVVSKAKSYSPSVWLASLDQLADWWASREHATWTLDASDSENLRVWLRVPRGATVLTKPGQGSRAGSRVYRDYVQADPIAQRGDELSFRAGDSRRRSVGLSRECDSKLQGFLEKEGFWVERSEHPDGHAFYLDGYRTFQDTDGVALLDRIDSTAGPLLRLWRWPNGARSVLTISSDVDSITLKDFVLRAVHF